MASKLNLVVLVCLPLIRIFFYVLHTLHDHEGSLDVLTYMLKVFLFDVYAFLDPGDTLSFVTPYMYMRFDVCPHILLEP